MKSYDVTISDFFSAVLSHFSVTCKTSVQQFAKLNFGSLNFDVGTDFFGWIDALVAIYSY